ncbi:MAG: hypothetical protein WC334_06185, partial [Kiritimatiellales bacterium]
CWKAQGEIGVMNLLIRNFAGSFADAAVLFPLLILLGASGQFSPSLLFASAGLVYLFSGLYFRIPMPVQPLKSPRSSPLIQTISLLQTISSLQRMSLPQTALLSG